jgi:acetyl esterase
MARPETPGRWSRLRERVRRDLGAALVDGFFMGTARAGRLVPLSNPRLHNIEVVHDIAYSGSGEQHHRLDIYRPRGARRPLPTVIYFHGGGFRILSKDSHWVFGLLYARRGYLVVNANYRLAPDHRYPKAHEDAFSAYAWVIEHIAEYGGDPSQIILAGESAGGNLAAALAIAASYPRREPWAREMFDRGASPRAVVSGCALLQVSEPDRFARNGRVSRFIQDRLEEVTEAYLPRGTPLEECELADPVRFLEQGAQPSRPLPPFFAFCGTWDVLIDDTRRLGVALERLGVMHEVRYYQRGLHGFHAFVFDPNARQCWRDTFAFLSRALPRVPEPATRLFVR